MCICWMYHTEYLRDGMASGKRFFKFPANPQMKTHWRKFIKRQHGRMFDVFFFARTNTVICEKHFKPEEMVEEGKQKGKQKGFRNNNKKVIALSSKQICF